MGFCLRSNMSPLLWSTGVMMQLWCLVCMIFIWHHAHRYTTILPCPYFHPDLKCTLRSSDLILKNVGNLLVSFLNSSLGSSTLVCENRENRIVCFGSKNIFWSSALVKSSVLAQKDRLLWSLRSSASGRIVCNGLYRSHHLLINKRKIYGPYNMVLSLKI